MGNARGLGSEGIDVCVGLQVVSLAWRVLVLACTLCGARGRSVCVCVCVCAHANCQLPRCGGGFSRNQFMPSAVVGELCRDLLMPLISLSALALHAD